MLNPERIWEYRLLYLDLNDLLSKNRALETHFQRLIENKTRTVKTMLASQAGCHFPAAAGHGSTLPLNPPQHLQGFSLNFGLPADSIIM